MAVYKRKGLGSARHYLGGRNLTMKRYLQTFYSPYDWDIIRNFFFQNPVQARTIIDDFSKTNETKVERIMQEMSQGKSKIVIICGSRGGGKTSLAMYLAEKLYQKERINRIYFVGEQINKQLFPEWIRVVSDVEKVPAGSFAIIDESSIKYSARRSMEDSNVALSSFIAIARHNDLTILFITQHLNLIDINIFRLRDMIFFLRSSDYQIGERGGKHKSRDKFYEKVRRMMMARQLGECLFEMPSKRRFINFKYPLPEFWNDNISKLFKGFKPSEIKAKERIDRAVADEDRKLEYYKKRQEAKVSTYVKHGMKPPSEESNDNEMP